MPLLAAQVLIAALKQESLSANRDSGSARSIQFDGSTVQTDKDPSNPGSFSKDGNH